MVPIYRIFSRDFESCLDFSDDMLYEHYEHESRGLGVCSPRNGFFYGKKYMDVAVASWREDIRLGTLLLFELYQDNTFPLWWLDKVFSKEYSVIFKDAGLIT